MQSTPDEFAVFLKAFFSGDLFTQETTLEQIQQHTAAGVDKLGPGTIYAHGMLDNNGVLGHGGQTLGFLSDGGYIPDEDVIIVMWSNAAESNVSRAIVPGIVNTVVEAQSVGRTAPSCAPPTECFAQLPACTETGQCLGHHVAVAPSRWH